ncbi:hypothetical protein [Quadrisphaera sp. KR29]|uniref:hypothetical protein n=1 Tax=Quadrisphaera sp. KR29 TaxID=3461391 RepID=UPI004043F161
MTTTSSTHSSTPGDAPVAAPRAARAARAARGAQPWRPPLTALAGGALLTGAVLFTAGMVTSPPQASESTADYLAGFAAAPVQTQVSAALLHFGNLGTALGLLAVPALPRVRRGALLATAGALLSALGALVLSGWVMFDFIGLQLALQVPAEQAVSVYDATFASPFFAYAGILQAFAVLGNLAVLVGLVRAGVLRWWWAAVPVLTVPLLAAVPFNPLLHGALTAVGVLPWCAVGVVLLRRARLASTAA